MSCIQLSEKHISAVAHGLAFILNGAGGMCRLAASYELPELYDALIACRYPHDFLFDDRKIYAVLYKLNEAASPQAVCNCFRLHLVSFGGCSTGSFKFLLSTQIRSLWP